MIICWRTHSANVWSQKMNYHGSRCFGPSTEKYLESIRWVRKPTSSSISFMKVHRIWAKLWNTQQRTISYSESFQAVKVLSQRIQGSCPSVYESQELDILYNNQDSKSMTGLLIREIVELQLWNSLLKRIQKCQGRCLELKIWLYEE